MENEMQMNWWSHLQDQGRRAASAAHAGWAHKTKQKKGDDNEKIEAVVLAALKSKNKTKFNAFVGIKIVGFFLR